MNGELEHQILERTRKYMHTTWDTFVIKEVFKVTEEMWNEFPLKKEQYDNKWREDYEFAPSEIMSWFKRWSGQEK